MMVCEHMMVCDHMMVCEHMMVCDTGVKLSLSRLGLGEGCHGLMLLPGWRSVNT